MYQQVPGESFGIIELTKLRWRAQQDQTKCKEGQVGEGLLHTPGEDCDQKGVDFNHSPIRKFDVVCFCFSYEILNS